MLAVEGLVRYPRSLMWWDGLWHDGLVRERAGKVRVVAKRGGGGWLAGLDVTVGKGQ